jgi:ATP-dependent Lon protease
VPVAHVDDVIAQALVRKPVAIEWVEPPESPVPVPVESPVATPLAH